ncbi:hypothetical protein L596_024283 [Steinernema carpocapsae]|uniref:Uncharacterized protein n=1 Tax=Steinernema carpocapsae TaxID=34508 RepID=A0A4U5MGJ5_STECR|nr:hypothetical protein L596_024283 [Steinernema carpocapsae]
MLFFSFGAQLTFAAANPRSTWVFNISRRIPCHPKSNLRDRNPTVNYATSPHDPQKPKITEIDPRVNRWKHKQRLGREADTVGVRDPLEVGNSGE